MNAIYFDNAASTPVLPEVWDAMRPFFTDVPGNPASSHRFGRHARLALDQARETIARCLDAEADEVLFTSGATEANNLALFGLAREPGTICVSAIEHPCVGEPALKLRERGFRLQTLGVGRDGKTVPPDGWPDDIRLAAVMLANHETGAVQPIHELNAPAPIHCDAAAAVGRIAVSFKQLGVASLTLSGHKFHGPKGCGALLLRKGTKLTPQVFGGHQQGGKRPGTEAVPLAVGLAKALELATRDLDLRHSHVTGLRRRFLEQLEQGARPIVPTGLDPALPYVCNVSFPGCRADALLIAFDLAGIACSTGSACSSGSPLPSPVLEAMRVPREVLTSAIRFSFSALNTLAEVHQATQAICQAVKRIRSSIRS